jgi:hypothetical protein
MIISFPNPNQISLIYKEILFQATLIQSKKGIPLDKPLELYYRSGLEKSCKTCLNDKIVTGKKCRFYDPKTYSKDVRCNEFKNFIGYGIIKEIKPYDSFLELDPEEWRTAEGFKSLEEGIEYYSKKYHEFWKEEKLIIIKWKLKRLGPV